MAGSQDLAEAQEEPAGQRAIEQAMVETEHDGKHGAHGRHAVHGDDLVLHGGNAPDRADMHQSLRQGPARGAEDDALGATEHGPHVGERRSGQIAVEPFGNRRQTAGPIDGVECRREQEHRRAVGHGDEPAHPRQPASSLTLGLDRRATLSRQIDQRPLGDVVDHGHGGLHASP
jgi:hypothetical protein